MSEFACVNKMIRFGGRYSPKNERRPDVRGGAAEGMIERMNPAGLFPALPGLPEEQFTGAPADFDPLIQPFGDEIGVSVRQRQVK